MVKFFLMVLLVIPSLCRAQIENNSVLRKGLLRTQGTFSFGSLLDIKETGIYLNGNLEYYINQKISGRGDLYYHLKSTDNSLLKINHQLFSGGSYHINLGKEFDPYIGLQPGIALTQHSFYDRTTNLTPLLSSLIGFNYYAENWFHLFFDIRYVYGIHSPNHINEINISEIRLSFGLGFNLNTK
ncbi:MAG: hypothetical protein JKY30_05920 [Flavobacteriales bacterium]|nr:hypothetical protein [Flavobacteriales bacterium]